MKTHRIATALFVALTVIVAGTTAHAAIYIQIPDVKGESRETNNDQWVDVLSVSWGAHKPGEGLTGQSRRRGAAVVEDVTLTIEYEKASPKLQESCLQGEVIPKLEILETSNGGDRIPYFQWVLTNPRVTSYEVNGGAGNDVVAVTLNFEEFKVTYHEYKPADGSADAAAPGEDSQNTTARR